MTNIAQQYIDLYENSIVLRMTDGYGIARNYRVMNSCPQCRTKLHITGEYHGCFDGEWTQVDNFTCENNHNIQYQEIFKFNDIER